MGDGHDTRHDPAGGGVSDGPLSRRVVALVWLGLSVMGWAVIGLGVVAVYHACGPH